MSESKLQTKIIKLLKANGYWTLKVVVANRAGIPDIVACSPEGLFIAIEVKSGDNKPSKLQQYNIDCINKNKGKAFCAWSVDDVKRELNL